MNFDDSSMNEETFFDKLLKKITEYRSSERNGKFLLYRSPSELTEILDLDRPAGTGDWEEILRWIETYLAYSVKTNHPAFVNRMWVGANLPSLAGEIITVLTNTSACTFESAPVATLIEKYMIAQMLALAGFTGGEGQMTTGSSNANMIAMMTARNLTNSSIKRAGLFGQQKLFAFVSADAHYSMDKAANILGLGTDQLIKIPLDQTGAMQAEALDSALDKVRISGGVPFFVTATAGTTVRGAYDPIEPLLALRRKYGFWLHVDGAWGGGAIFSPTLKEQFLPGLQQADSFTCDFHKMLGATLMCNVLLINNKDRALHKTLSAGDGSYLFRDEYTTELEDPGVASLQCGRRVDSLKWFLDWKFFGREGLAERVEKNLALCQYAENWVQQSSELEMVVPRTSFNVCFRFKVGEEISNSFNLALRNRLYRHGTSLVGVAYIEGRMVMRLVLNNPAAEQTDIDTFFHNVLQTGRELLEK